MSNAINNSAPIRTVVLDYGEVLCFPPTPEEIARMARIFHLDAPRFWEIYIGGRAPYDRADLTAVDYWRHFASQAGVELPPHMFDSLRQWDLDMWSRTNAPMLEWLEHLPSPGIKTTASPPSKSFAPTCNRWPSRSCRNWAPLRRLASWFGANAQVLVAGRYSYDSTTFTPANWGDNGGAAREVSRVFCFAF